MGICGGVCVVCVNRYVLLLELSGVVEMIIGRGSLWVLMEGGMKRAEGAGRSDTAKSNPAPSFLSPELHPAPTTSARLSHCLRIGPVPRKSAAGASGDD